MRVKVMQKAIPFNIPEGICRSAPPFVCVSLSLIVRILIILPMPFSEQ